jgi:hypothetical protein
MSLSVWRDVGPGRRWQVSRWLPSRRGGALVALTLFVQVTSGCLSSQYCIPNDELMRLAQTPVAKRGEHVHVVQGLGDRRSAAVEYHAPPPPPPLPPPPPPALPPAAPPAELAPPVASQDPVANPDPAAYQDPLAPDGEYADGPSSDGEAQINISIDGSDGTGPGWRHHGAGPAHGLRGAGSSSRGGLRGTPPSTGWRGTPPAAGGHGSAPSARGGGSHGGGGIGHFGGGGGGHSSGGGGGDAGAALAILAIVLVAIAVVAGVSLVASEGMRFDGYAEMAPDQSIHIKNERGLTTTVSLASLTPYDASVAVEATVNDDEDHGLRLHDRGPLNRIGMAFKMELGSTNFNLGLQQIAGMASQIQVGAFITRSAGVMLDIGLSGGSVCCSSILSRHSLALEGQVFPWSVGRLHIGGFAKGGVAIVGDADGTQSGPIVGGGALFELALTTRLALTFRAAANSAHLDSGWSTAGALTGGIAVY